jgi:enoyl-CoA hydratase/carnithine racemase
MGLVQEVLASEDLLPYALQLAARIAEQAPLAIRATIESSRQAVLEGEASAAQQLPRLINQLMSTDDAREGLLAMQERRPAVFNGR